MSRFPHGGEILGATPANPLLAPVLRPGRDLNRQQAMLDLAAIQRIPGLVGYWPADPAYLFEDSSGTIPASVGGVVGVAYDISRGAVGIPLRNGLKYSEDFTNSGWAKTGLQAFGSGSVANATTAPDGTTTADKIAEDASTGNHYLYQQWTLSITGRFTFSCYLKVAERSWAVLYGSNMAVSACYINLSTGELGTVSGTGSPTATITAAGDNWYRVALTFTKSTAGDVFAGVLIATGDGVASYAGSAGSGIYVWGGQAEFASAASEYQKTTTGLSEYVPGNHAVQPTTANKPYLRKTPRSGVYWLDSNTNTSAITATLGNLGTACTVARSGPDGPYFLENITISSTYNIAPAYGFGGEVAIFNRALTASEKALITRYMRRYDTLYGSLVNASPQMRGVTANTEMVPNFGVITNFTYAWRGCSSLITFPLLDTSAGTNFAYAWHSCSSLTTFPLLDTSAGTTFASAWYSCSSLTTFPLLDTSAGTTFAYAWYSCSSLTSFPLLDTSAGTNFDSAWYSCSSLTSFPLLDTSAGTNFTNAWRSCSSLTTFPLLDTSAGTNFTNAWAFCSSLTTFPANFFDAWGATPVADCFFGTWYNCNALTQTSLNNIVASLAVSGKAAPATGTAITLNGAPLLTTMQADSAFMTAINTLKSRNWTPTYKGTAL